MNQQRRRIVVTGIGCLTPIGNGVDNFWKGLVEGKSGVSPITTFDASVLSTRIAADVKDFNADDFMPKKDAKRMDRVIQFAVAASKLALDDSGLQINEDNASRIGVIIGSGIGGMITYEVQHRALIEQGPRRISPFFIPMMIANMASGQVSIQFGLRGPSYSVISACATGNNCIASAMDTILTGRADAMLAGGAEAAITLLAVAGFCAMRALSQRNDDPEKASRPFDKERDGFVMAEGAGVLMLEEREHAIRRGARIYGELSGYGCTSDAYHISNPDPEGTMVAEAMRTAIADAGLKPEDIDYINAHATSTPVGDPCEAAAIHRVFGDHAKKVAVSSTKSMIGHCLGSAGSLETIVCLLAAHHGIIPPTINYHTPDPECDLDVVPNVARKVPIKHALNNSFGFGGHNAVIAVSHHPAGA